MSIDKLKILDGHRDYSANWTEGETTIIGVTLRKSKGAIEISDRIGQGLFGLWALFITYARDLWKDLQKPKLQEEAAERLSD